MTLPGVAHGVAIDEQTGSRQLNLDDEIVRSTCITHAGQILHRATLERCAAAKGESLTDERQPSA